MTQTRPTDQYAADLFFPNRHAHLSIPLPGSKQTIHVYFMFSTYLIFPNDYCHSVIICDIFTHLFEYLNFSYFIICMNNYGYHVFL